MPSDNDSSKKTADRTTSGGTSARATATGATSTGARRTAHTSASDGATTAAVPEGYVRVTVPKRYGLVAVRGQDGRLKDYRGGETAVMPEAQARSLGALDADGKPVKPASEEEGDEERPEMEYRSVSEVRADPTKGTDYLTQKKTSGTGAGGVAVNPDDERPENV